VDQSRKVSRFKRFINAPGWIAFVLVVPAVLAAVEEGVASLASLVDPTYRSRSEAAYERI
jgi:hypothetical protein